METTTNYNLKMPSSAEVLKMDDINEDMNVIDESLKGLDDKITKHEANLSHIPYAVATGSVNSYEVTIDQAPTTYEDGMAVCVKINNTSTGASTLNVNGLGAQAIVDSYGNPITGEGLKVNTPYIMRYESVSQSFIVQGKGGGGNATADQILDGVTATVDGGPITGTMPNNGAVVITPSTVNQAISKGYHNGDGYVEGDSNLKTENIKAGTSIFGVKGKDSVVETSDATATEDKILEGYTSYVNGSKVTGTMPNNGELDATLDINGTYTIPAGYTDGGTVTQDIPTKEAETYTPGKTNQTIASGQYLSGIQTILGDANLITDNIKAGASIFGVAGEPSVVDTGDATATADQILSGKTVYINGSKITGNMPNKSGNSQTFSTLNDSTGNIGNVTQITDLSSGRDAALRIGFKPSQGYYDGNTEELMRVWGVTPSLVKAGAPIGYVNSTLKGTFTSDATATKDQILNGYSAYVNGQKINGQATLQSLGGRRFISIPNVAKNSPNISFSDGTVSSGININISAYGINPECVISMNNDGSVTTCKDGNAVFRASVTGGYSYRREPIDGSNIIVNSNTLKIPIGISYQADVIYVYGN